MDKNSSEDIVPSAGHWKAKQDATLSTLYQGSYLETTFCSDQRCTMWKTSVYCKYQTWFLCIPLFGVVKWKIPNALQLSVNMCVKTFHEMWYMPHECLLKIELKIQNHFGPCELEADWNMRLTVLQEMSDCCTKTETSWNQREHFNDEMTFLFHFWYSVKFYGHTYTHLFI